jgi:proton-coupled amino acid transporter
MLHYKACSHTKKQKAADIALIIFGLVAATYTTIQTLKVRKKILFVGITSPYLFRFYS